MKQSLKKKVLVGMSGGVDSSVAAAILIEKGYEVVGVYMNLWADPTIFDLDEKKEFPQNKCCSIESLIFARSICQKLGMPFYSLNFENLFKENVVDFFLEEHKAGNTPNPCVRCNKTVKFGALFQKMLELGCDYLATGHYAKLIEDDEGHVSLHRGEDTKKDQTYFLYNLKQDQLKKLLFPLGDLEKDEVKILAKNYSLTELENRKESQGVCFYPEKSYLPFLKRFLSESKDFSSGAILDENGKEVGRHEGLPFYTVGQRKGLDLGGASEPLYVKEIDGIKNALIIGTEKDLYVDEVNLRDVNFLCGEAPDENEIFDVRIRHHGTLAKARINADKVKFLEPQRAVMAGQSLVIYRGTELVGGGIMC